MDKISGMNEQMKSQIVEQAAQCEWALGISQAKQDSDSWGSREYAWASRKASAEAFRIAQEAR